MFSLHVWGLDNDAFMMDLIKMVDVIFRVTLLSQLCRDTTIRVRIGEEAWGSCLHSRWGPLPLRQIQWSPERSHQLHSDSHFSEAPWEVPSGPGRSRGKWGFPAATQERHLESFFYASWGPSPLPWLENNDALLLATCKETWLPWRRTRRTCE